MRTARFLPFLSRAGTRFLNLRNHRKILSVDGRVAFVGGMNIRAGNLLQQPSRHHTRDVHFLVRGPVIDQINSVFAEDWEFSTGETLLLPLWGARPRSAARPPIADASEEESGETVGGAGGSGGSEPVALAGVTARLAMPETSERVAAGGRRTGTSTRPAVGKGTPAGSGSSASAKRMTGRSAGRSAWEPAAAASPGGVVARVLLDGPDDNYQKLQHTIIGAINVARESVDVVTPYFLPPRTVISALQIASLRGVRVRICVPEHNNLPFVGWAMEANVGKLVDYGIEIAASPPPFDHSKLCVVDDRWSLIGSSNWDARSLELNFEINLECYDRAFNDRLRRLVESRLAAARPLGGEPRDGLVARLRNNFYRLFSPYL